MDKADLSCFSFVFLLIKQSHVSNSDNLGENSGMEVALMAFGYTPFNILDCQAGNVSLQLLNLC